MTTKASTDAPGPFAAVDAFFGGDQDPKDKPTKETQLSSPHNHRRSSAGVGAGETSTSTNALRDSVLRVGGGRKKRKLSEEDDDDDENVHEEADNDNEDDDNDDDVGGRTSIAGDGKRKGASPVDTINPPKANKKKKKKKKKGKKEREKEREAAAAESRGGPTEHSSSGAKTDNNEKHKQSFDQPFEKRDEQAGAATKDPGSQQRRSGRKRHKVRSKQKNIRKDTRRDEDKPEHLRSGGGRPLTAETRRRLGLPPSKTSTQFSSFYEAQSKEETSALEKEETSTPEEKP